MPYPVWIYNPLPAALRHYAGALDDVLSSAGFTVRSAEAPSVEVHGVTAGRRAAAALTELAGRVRAARAGGHLVVCWPTYGLADPALWLPAWRRSTVSVIVHDPTPLRRQLGMGRAAGALGRIAGRASHVRVVVHSEPARARLGAIGWGPLTLLPHPVWQPRPARRGPGAGDPGAVLVCGQYKPARNLGLLAALGPLLRDRGHRALVAGRGWPAVAGWEVDDRFLSEAELEERIRASTAVLIPYEHFYQSGIAVRALELGVPVVGPDHPFLADLFGATWPGLVPGRDPVAWADAVAAVAGAGRLDAAADAFRVRCVRDWATYLG